MTSWLIDDSAAFETQDVVEKVRERILFFGVRGPHRLIRRALS